MRCKTQNSKWKGKNIVKNEELMNTMNYKVKSEETNRKI